MTEGARLAPAKSETRAVTYSSLRYYVEIVVSQTQRWGSHGIPSSFLFRSTSPRNVGSRRAHRNQRRSCVSYGPPSTYDTHHDLDRTYIMPGHSGCFQDRDGTPNVILDVLEVHHASVIVILSREQRPLETGGVDVGKWVVVRVPATITEIKTTDGSDVIVHDNNLLVVGPKLNRICGQRSE